MKVIFSILLILSFSCAHDSRKEEFSFKNFFRKPKKAAKIQKIIFEQPDKIDLEKSEISLYYPYPKLMADEATNYAIRIKLYSTTGALLNVNPKLISMKGLVSSSWEVFRIKPGEYLVSGLKSKEEGLFKVHAFVGAFQLKKYLDVKFENPFSSANSEWKLVGKPESHLRIYQLVIKNLKNEIIKVVPKPEIIIEGDAIAEAVIPEENYYLVKIRFDCDDCAVYFGYRAYGQSILRFQRINFKAVNIDDQKSYAYASKLKARADGLDTVRVYFRLLNDVGYAIYQTKDFMMNLISNRPDDIIEGPIDGNIGVYFKIRSKKPGISQLKFWVDRLKISAPVEVEFLKPKPPSLSLRTKCLEEIVRREPLTWSENDIELNSNFPDYDRAWSKLKRVYSEKGSGSFDQFLEYSEILSFPACVMTPDFDELRAESVHKLHRMTRDKMR